MGPGCMMCAPGLANSMWAVVRQKRLEYSRRSGEQARLLAFELEAQAHDGVHVAHGFLAVRVDRDGPVVHARGQEGARGAQADVHAELGEQQYVGAADAAVGAVTEDKQVFVLEGVPVVSPDLTQGKGVEQGLGGMRVPAVPGVDHAAV